MALGAYYASAEPRILATIGILEFRKWDAWRRQAIHGQSMEIPKLPRLRVEEKKCRRQG